MAKINKSINIQAPIEKVFAFMTDPENFAKAQPPESETKIIAKPEGPPGVGRTWKMSMKAGGQIYKWDAKITEFMENQKVTGSQTGGPFKRLEWTQSFESINGSTKYSITSEYKMPYSMLGKIIDKLKVEKEMDKNFDYYIKKTKELIEKDQ